MICIRIDCAVGIKIIYICVIQTVFKRFTRVSAEALHLTFIKTFNHFLRSGDIFSVRGTVVVATGGIKQWNEFCKRIGLGYSVGVLGTRLALVTDFFIAQYVCYWISSSRNSRMPIAWETCFGVSAVTGFARRTGLTFNTCTTVGDIFPTR